MTCTDAGADTAYGAVNIFSDCQEQERGRHDLGNRAESWYLIEIGRRIREKRQKAGMSQETLAEKAGISPVTVSRIEGGVTAASVETFQKLAQALGSDAAEVLSGGVCGGAAGTEGAGIFSRIGRMGQKDREVVMQTMESLMDALEKNN